MQRPTIKFPMTNLCSASQIKELVVHTYVFYVHVHGCVIIERVVFSQYFTIIDILPGCDFFLCRTI